MVYISFKKYELGKPRLRGPIGCACKPRAFHKKKQASHFFRFLLHFIAGELSGPENGSSFGA